MPQDASWRGFTKPRNRPPRWGKCIVAFIHDTIDEDVGKRLREEIPNPHFGENPVVTEVRTDEGS